MGNTPASNRTSLREKLALSVLAEIGVRPDAGGMFLITPACAMSKSEQDALNLLCEMGYDYKLYGDE